MDPISHAIAFPNPFFHEVRIACYLKETGKVDVSIYDESGNKVWSVSTNPIGIGYNEVGWDGKDTNGIQVMPGMYTCIISQQQNGGSLRILSGVLVKR